jgi:hypothetical protein
MGWKIMAEYESGTELDSKDDSYISKEASEMGDEIYDESDKYDSHDDVINMLKAAQWADHDNREKAARLTCSFLSGMGSGNHTGGTTTSTSPVTRLTWLPPLLTRSPES